MLKSFPWLSPTTLMGGSRKLRASLNSAPVSIQRHSRIAGRSSERQARLAEPSRAELRGRLAIHTRANRNNLGDSFKLQLVPHSSIQLFLRMKERTMNERTDEPFFWNIYSTSRAETILSWTRRHAMANQRWSAAAAAAANNQYARLCLPYSLIGFGRQPDRG